MKSERTFSYWMSLSLVLIIIDQLSKYLVLLSLRSYESVPITSFFNITLQHNPGAAFSILATQGGWQRWFFTALAIVVSLVIIWFLKKKPGSSLFNFALSAILSGAIGNVIDRFFHGYVIDFMDFYIHSWHYPAFNAADSFITIGVICILIEDMVLKKIR